MINFFYQNLSKFFYLQLLRLSPKIYKYSNFKDLNFKQNDFVNYKVVKHYVLKENFINSSAVLDIHTFDFLLRFQLRLQSIHTDHSV